jgi:predicted transposase/invertase (TIGR01784 family)
VGNAHPICFGANIEVAIGCRGVPKVIMVFINPKTDFAFKKIFGSEQSKDILISFLNALLYKGNPIIEDLEILDPYQTPRILGIKDTYLDVKARITGNKTVIIEMQVLNVEGFEKRILYNAAKAYSIQLQKGQGYTSLNPVIALTITDFEMFKTRQNVSSRFVLKEKDELFDYPIEELELVFVELPKFNKELDELETVTDKWIYFMKSARSLRTVPEIMGSVPEIRQAFEIASEANLTPEELEDLEKREIFIQDQRNAIIRGVREGLKEAKQEAKQEAREEAREEGREEGALEAKLEIAKRLLDTLGEEAVSQMTGLSIEEIRRLL